MDRSGSNGIPRYSGKSALSDLAGLPHVPLNLNNPLSDSPCLYSRNYGGFTYDYLFSPKLGSERLFVLFSGDAPRTKFNPPVFQRWKWSQFFPGHCLYISDPTLQVNSSLGLAWYAGTEAFDPLIDISSTISVIAKRLGVDTDSVYMYGSSGGGFASLRMLKFLPEASAICINPQTNISNYQNGVVDRFFGACFGGRSRSEMTSEFSDRICLTSQASALLGKNIIYIQNVLDSHHYNDHYLPFCQAMGEVPLHPSSLKNCKVSTKVSSRSFRTILFSHKDGHSKAETNEAFDCAIKSLSK